MHAPGGLGSPGGIPQAALEEKDRELAQMRLASKVTRVYMRAVNRRQEEKFLASLREAEARAEERLKGFSQESAAVQQALESQLRQATSTAEARAKMIELMDTELSEAQDSSMTEEERRDAAERRHAAMLAAAPPPPPAQAHIETQTEEAAVTEEAAPALAGRRSYSLK